MRIANQFRLSTWLSIIFVLFTIVCGLLWASSARETREKQALIHLSIQLNHQLEILNVEYLLQGSKRQQQQWDIVHNQLQQVLSTLSESAPEPRQLLNRAQNDLARMQQLFSQLVSHSQGVRDIPPSHQPFASRLKGQLKTSTASLTEGMSALSHLHNTHLNTFVRESILGLSAILILFVAMIFWLQGVVARKTVAKVVALDRKVRNFSLEKEAAEASVSTGNELDTLTANFEKMAASIDRSQQRLKQEIDKVKDTEERLALVVDSARLGYWDWQIQTGKHAVNKRWLEMLGMAPDEMKGQASDWSDRIHPEDRQRLEPFILQQIKEHRSYAAEFRMRHNNGHWVWILGSGAGVEYDPQTDEPIRACGIHQDITERKQAEAALQAEKELLSVTLRSIGDAVITTDTKGKITSINQVAETLTGWTEQDARGEDSKKVFHIINEKTGEQCASPVQRVLELGRIIGLANHTALIAKDGSQKSIADSGAPIRDASSKIIGVVIVFRDITKEQMMEEEILKGRKLEAVGVLAGGIAHDFNNILAAILGNIELANRRLAGTDAKVEALLAGAFKATRRATKLTQQLLTFAKGGDPVRESTSLPDLIRDSADFILPGSKISCEYRFAEDLWPVEVDSGQISQVIQNIILNADQAMPEGGRVEIHCSNVDDPAKETLLSVHQGRYVRIAIRDTGIGIPAELTDKIFDPYFTTKQAGSGLGLAICHSIVSKHDGFLTVDSMPGKGTTFFIFLPAALQPVSEESTKPQPALAIKAATILVMDDEEMLRNLAKSQLETLGHKPILVTDGEQALNKYQQLQDDGSPVDLVIMDLTVSGGMGGQLASQKLLQIDPEAKIIVASGYSNDPILANFKEFGFRAAIAKPYDLHELSGAILRAI